MIRSALLGLAVIALSACGYSEDDFTDDYTDAFCTKLSDCEGDIVTAYTELGMDEASAQTTYDDTYALACESEATEDSGGDVESECEFNSDNAKTCVADVEAMSCEFFTTGTGYPESCNGVCE